MVSQRFHINGTMSPKLHLLFHSVLGITLVFAGVLQQPDAAELPVKSMA